MIPKTKIICTIGPASSDRSVLRKMMRAGMDVVRLNFSHANHAQHLKRIELIRGLNRAYRRRIRILQDLEGYRIRIGRLESPSGISLKKGQAFTLTTADIPGCADTANFDFQGPLRIIKPGMSVFIDDGNIHLVVTRQTKNTVRTKVVAGGILKERKGINIPGLHIPFKGLTDKDRRDLIFGIGNRMDFIAQSFVRNREDVEQIKGRVAPSLPGCKIIAKIENEEGIRNIDDIIKAADGIMIARGDMGVSIPLYKIPVVQKNIIKKCNKARKMVITATQMLESMTGHPRPTRAEVADVANAIIDGSGYLMLSAETAVGTYPVEAVSMMNEVIKYTESSFKKI